MIYYRIERRIGFVVVETHTRTLMIYYRIERGELQIVIADILDKLDDLL